MRLAPKEAREISIIIQNSSAAIFVTVQECDATMSNREHAAWKQEKQAPMIKASKKATGSVLEESSFSSALKFRFSSVRL